ncbi:hypothetical protein NSTC745_03871 [Nostoc sp. DSM 114161]|jgi:hypothetical protein|uniref:hypothetical protein n=1 Tax=Nostoc sp. DSM 114161 TaxID=3440143 RepID=UPI0040465962
MTVTPNQPPSDSLPANFKSFEHLQKVYRQQYNALVRRYFSDLGNDWKPNIATSRSALRVACEIVDDDNDAVMRMRTSLFFDILGQSRKDLITYYGSKEDIAPPVEGHPIVKLYFSQDKASVPVGQNAVDAEYSFRLMNETAATFTELNAKSLANKVKAEFIEARKGVVFTKGKNIYYYKDKAKGYELRLYGNVEADAIDLIRRFLACQDVVFDDDKMTVSTPKKASQSTPTTVTAYEKQVKARRYRPTANVRFRYAYVQIPNIKNPVFLIDTTSRYNSLVAV